MAQLGPEEIAARATAGTLLELPGIGKATAAVITESLRGELPAYLAKLEPGSDAPLVSVYVANLLDYQSVEQASADFPGVTQVHQTPLVALYDSVQKPTTAAGKPARDLLAKHLNLAPEELSRRLLERIPRYVRADP